MSKKKSVLASKSWFALCLMIALAGCSSSGSGSTSSALGSEGDAGASYADASASRDEADCDGKHHGRGHRAPPAEAFEACASKAVGDACTVAFDDEEIAGTCVAPRNESEGTAFCLPERMPPEGRGGHHRPHGPRPPEDGLNRHDAAQPE